MKKFAVKVVITLVAMVMVFTMISLKEMKAQNNESDFEVVEIDEVALGKDILSREDEQEQAVNTVVVEKLESLPVIEEVVEQYVAATVVYEAAPVEEAVVEEEVVVGEETNIEEQQQETVVEEEFDFIEEEIDEMPLGKDVLSRED